MELENIMEESVKVMENDFYSKKFYFSYSSLNKLLWNPVVFHSMYILGIKEEKVDQHLVQGKIIHALLLEEENFNDQFIVSPGKLPGDGVRAVVDRVFNHFKELSLSGDTRTNLEHFDGAILDVMKDMNYFQALKTDQQRLDKIISQRDKGTSIGFGADVKNNEEKKTGEWMKDLEPEDLLKYGLIPEFIGRLPMIATLEDLDEKSLIKILQEPKNSLIKQYQELFKLDGAKLSFKDNAVKEIALKAIQKKTGARGLRSILENILLKTMYDLPSQDNVEEVIVDSGAAKGQSQPVIVHSKNNKVKNDKTSAA